MTVGIVLALLAGLGFTVFGLGAFNQAVASYDAASWVWSTNQGEVARINGVTAKVDTRVDVAQAKGHIVQLNQSDRFVLLRDNSTGLISSLDLTSLQVAGSQPGQSGIQPGDQSRFNSFVAAYEAHGNGAIAISAPTGVNSQAMIGFFAQRINEMGVSKDRILVATHDAPDGDMRVEINYVSYQAHSDTCGDWSQDLTFTGDNETIHNFGCAVQRNVAAQLATLPSGVSAASTAV